MRIIFIKERVFPVGTKRRNLAKSAFLRVRWLSSRPSSCLTRLWKTYVTHDSIFFDRETLWMCGFEHGRKLDFAIELFSPTSILDVGCGLGRSLQYLISKGVEGVGIEGSKLAIDSSAVKDRIIHHNLYHPIDLAKKFDLVWCVEVAEHIHPNHLQNFLDILTHHSEIVVMSAAPPGQGGELHFNEQPEEYWIARFDERGYAFDSGSTTRFREIDEVFSENVFVFRRV